MADYTDNTTTQSSGYSGFGKTALGAGLAGGALAATNAYTGYIQDFLKNYLFNAYQSTMKPGIGVERTLIGNIEYAWDNLVNNNPNILSFGIGILGVFAAFLLYKFGKKVYDLFKDWLVSKNINTSQIDEENGAQIVQESDESSYENAKSWGKAATGAGLAGAAAYGLSKAIPQYSSTSKWIENGQEMMKYNFDKTKTFLAEFLNEYPELAKYLVSIKENPGTTALATVGTVLAGYGLYKGLKAWREFLQKKKAENPDLEIPANA